MKNWEGKEHPYVTGVSVSRRSGRPPSRDRVAEEGPSSPNSIASQFHIHRYHKGNFKNGGLLPGTSGWPKLSCLLRLRAWSALENGGHEQRIHLIFYVNFRPKGKRQVR